ncbi:LPXTG cell wall anchor domain-containing protein [Vagococcus sp. JNUCC 83]
MKRKHIVLTVFTLILSLITCNLSVYAVDSGQTSVSIGFTKDTELKPDKPTVVPPTGGDNSGESNKPSSTTPQTSGRLPQTGELINYWLIFNGILLLVMLLFIFGISKDRENDKDIYLA